MSSSDHLERPEFVDLRQGVPPARGRQFVEQHEFEHVDRGPVREITPDEAYRSGLAEGEQRGRESAIKELVPVISELKNAARSMAHVREQRLAELEEEILDVAVNVARRVLRGELRMDGDSVVHMARACLSEAAAQGNLILHVAPGDVDLMRTHVPEIEADLSEARLHVQADPTVPPGGVVLETPHHVFEGRPERVLEAALRNELPEQAEAEDA